MNRLPLQVRFKGGATRTLTLPPPQPAWATWQTSPEVVAEVDRLLNDHTDAQIAALLNERGWHSGKGRAFTKRMIFQIRCQYRLRSRFDRLREAGMLTQQEIADQLGDPRDNRSPLAARWTAQGPCIPRQARVPVRARGHEPTGQDAGSEAHRPTTIPQGFL